MVSYPNDSSFMKTTVATLGMASATVLLLGKRCNPRMNARGRFHCARGLNGPIVFLIGRLSGRGYSCSGILRRLHDVCNSGMIPIRCPLRAKPGFRRLVSMLLVGGCS